MTSTNFNLCIPSKTFLIGEYSVLVHGRAVIMAHAPYFQCVPNQNLSWPSHPATQDYQKITQTFGFLDPHNGQGGFGASSALILSLAHHTKPFDIQLAHALNKKYSPNSSGADVISQYFGQLSLVNTNTLSAKPIQLSENCGITIIRTTIKINTHEHLNNKLVYDTMHLNQLLDHFLMALNNINQMAKIINDYEKALQKNGLRHPSAIDYVNNIKKIPNVLAVKGCGALGADVLMILSHKDHQQQIIDQLPKPLTVIATEQDFAKGLI
jgi:mevalonate kinase